MNDYPCYVSIDFQKRYDKIYRNVRYKNKELVELLSYFGFTIDKLDSKELYFTAPIDINRIDYILKCLLLDIRGVCADNIKDNASTISKMERGDITKAFQFFIPKSKKYSLVDLINVISSYKARDVTQDELLNLILDCPDNRVLSLDLMIYVNKKSPRKYTSTLPIISNDELIFEFIHNLLFGRDSGFCVDLKSGNYICIDNGKEISEAKCKEYKIVDKDTRVVSNNEKVANYAIKLLSKYYSKNLEVADFIDIGPEKEIKTKRKAIPKAIRNELWKRHFGDKLKGSCFCCKCEIDALSHFEAGHIIASAKGGADNIDNLRPVCMSCNRSMSTMNMDEYISRYIK